MFGAGVLFDFEAGSNWPKVDANQLKPVPGRLTPVRSTAVQFEASCVLKPLWKTTKRSSKKSQAYLQFLIDLLVYPGSGWPPVAVERGTDDGPTIGCNAFPDVRGLSA